METTHCIRHTGQKSDVKNWVDNYLHFTQNYKASDKLIYKCKQPISSDKGPLLIAYG